MNLSLANLSDADLLTSQIAEVADWMPETIEACQKTLADLAVNTWPVK